MTSVGLSVKDIAKRLNVSERTIQREIKRGKLQATLIGRRLIISEEQLEAYVSQDISGVEERIATFCKEKKGQMVNLLQRLVTSQSPTNDPKAQHETAELLKTQLLDLGLRTITYGTADDSAVHSTFGYAKKGFLLDCPLDTNPVGDIEKWSYPPFDGIIRNGRMYGRGTADSKSGIVSMIFAVLALKEIIDEEKIRVEMLFDCGEQNGDFLGMQNALNHGLDVDCGIVGYAGTPYELAIGARGVHRYKITTKGRAAHTGSRTNKGVNAIRHMVKLLNALEELSFSSSKNDLFWFGCKVTPSMITGGNAVNVVPDECSALLDVRTVPEVTSTSIEKAIKSIITTLSKQVPDLDVRLDHLIGLDGYYVDPKERLVTATKESIERVANVNPTLGVNGPAHVGNILAKEKIPVVVKGPDGGNVHSYDEFVVLDSLPQTSQIYALTILKYFGLVD